VGEQAGTWREEEEEEEEEEVLEEVVVVAQREVAARHRQRAPSARLRQRRGRWSRAAVARA
jgi:hypothetical protein